MNDMRKTLIALIACGLAACLPLCPDGWPSRARCDEPSKERNQTQAGLDHQRTDAEQKSRPEIEQQRQEAAKEAEKAIDKDALAAMQQTLKAVKAIAASKTDEALAAIEQATGKLNVLLARHPQTALIPVDVGVAVIDTAPLDAKAVKDRAKAAERAVYDKDYPGARVLLAGLMSEIRVRTSNLPLGTYPAALKEAARLLDQKKNKEACATLMTALNTLVVIERVIPLPIAVAQAAISDAESMRDKDKDGARQKLNLAKFELERAKELGYMGQAPEYAALNKSISELEQQLKGTSDTGSLFTRLKERIASFFKRQSEASRG